MSNSLGIIIVEKIGSLKTLKVKDFKVEDLYKKCGFKKGEDFLPQTEWNVTIEKQKYLIQLYGKTEGKANMENKYDFPPPVDNILFFGSCALVCLTSNNSNKYNYCELNIELWNKIYEKLFGGFEDLALTLKDDDDEEDELDAIDDKYKTKNGYLKDGFVVDEEDDSFASYEESEHETISESDNDLTEICEELTEEDYIN
jgi:hypothetical protein